MTRIPATRHPRHAGAKPMFTAHLRKGLFDLKALRSEIEKAEGISEDPANKPTVRNRWRSYRDLIESALDVRIDLLEGDVDSHEAAIDEAGCPAVALCRAGVQTDPPHTELVRLGQLRIQTNLAASAV